MKFSGLQTCPAKLTCERYEAPYMKSPLFCHISGPRARKKARRKTTSEWSTQARARMFSAWIATAAAVSGPSSRHSSPMRRTSARCTKAACASAMDAVNDLGCSPTAHSRKHRAASGSSDSPATKVLVKDDSTTPRPQCLF